MHFDSGYFRHGHNARRTSVAAATALAFAGAAAVVQYRTHAAERDYPPRGKFLRCSSGRVHVLERGVGKPVVFLHGNGLTAEDFAASGLLESTGRTSRAIAIDRPGFGYSDRPWAQTWGADAQADLMLEAIAAMDVTRPIIVAHSWATMVALEMALRKPHQIAGLVLVSGYYFPSVRADVALMSPSAIPLLGDLLRYTFGPIAGDALKPRMIRKMFAPSPVPQAFWDRFPHALMTRPSQIRAGAEDAMHMIGAAHALAARYGDIEIPVAILAGDADEIVEPAQAQRLHHAIAKSTLDRVPGAGHMLHYTNPERVMQAIEALKA